MERTYPLYTRPLKNYVSVVGTGIQMAPRGPVAVIPVLPGISGRAVSPQPDDGFKKYVYDVGLLQGAWSDTVVTAPGLEELRVHALFVSQSPVLGRMLVDSGSSQLPHYLHLDVQDDGLTAAALSTALGTLYGHSLDGLSDCNIQMSRALLAAGCHLGLESVAKKGYELLLKNVSIDTLPELFALARLPSQLSGDNGYGRGPYPPYTGSMFSTLFEFLVHSVDSIVMSSKEIPAPVLKVLVELPFNDYKAFMESENLHICSAVDRQNFAKKITALREPAARQQGVDERVVLSFGGGYNGVEIIQKPRIPKRRPRH